MSRPPAVHRLSEVALTRTPGEIAWQGAKRDAIDRAWTQRPTESPDLFDGLVHFATRVQIAGDRLQADCIGGRFAALLYWRDQGFPDKSFRHVFGDGVLRSSDGALILARMAAHTANAGRVYFPGGVIDQKDVRDDHLDIDHNIRREVAEELGLAPEEIRCAPGYLVVVTDVALAVGRIVELPWSGDEACTVLMDRAQDSGDGEVDSLICIRSRADAEGLPIQPYARAIIEWAFP